MIPEARDIANLYLKGEFKMRMQCSSERPKHASGVIGHASKADEVFIPEKRNQCCCGESCEVCGGHVCEDCAHPPLES